jgi:predicted metal-dependent hydrolase
MPDEKHTIHDTQGTAYNVVVQRDKRLKKSARWTRERDGTILLRVPYRLPKNQIEPLLKDVAKSLEKQEVQRRRRSKRTDAGLQARAEHINQTCFGGRISWSAIKWVGNMEKRLGSCTNGGSTDGHIRISERIREWPTYVVDYVIAHELAHRVHSDHSRAFWEFLTNAYPHTDRARGFIEGNAFARGEEISEDDA